MENSNLYKNNNESIRTESSSSNSYKTYFKPTVTSSPFDKNNEIQNQHSTIETSTLYTKRKMRPKETKKRIKKNDDTTLSHLAQDDRILILKSLNRSSSNYTDIIDKQQINCISDVTKICSSISNNTATGLDKTTQRSITLKKSSSTKHKQVIANRNDTNSLNPLHKSVLISNPNQIENNEVQSTFDQVDSVTDENDSFENTVEQNKTFHTHSKVIYNNYKITNNINTMKNQSKYNNDYLNKTGPLEILKMELELKFFSGNIVPFLNKLQRDILRLDHYITSKPNVQKTKGSNVTDIIIGDIHNIIELNKNHCIDLESNENNNLTMPFEPVDFNSLNMLNHKLKWTKKLLNSIDSTLNQDKPTRERNIQEKSENNLDAQKDNDYLEVNTSSYCHRDLNSPDSILYTSDGKNSSIELVESDHSDHIRTLNKSKTLELPSYSIAVNKSPQEFNLENYSINDKQDDIIELNCKETTDFKTFNVDSYDSSLENHNINDKRDDVVELNDQDISETKLPDIYPPETEIHLGAPVKKRHFNHSHAGNVRTNREHQEGNQSKYNLRESPKPTDHFFAPFKFPQVKKKMVRDNSCHNEELYVFRKTGGKKVCLRYKVCSILKRDSTDLAKDIGIDGVTNKCNNFRISNMMPKKNKPCRCGIYPSQVPPYWSNKSHASIHQNLHKLLFESHEAVVEIKINDGGLIYDIIKISQPVDDDGNLKSILKNINEFIDLELNFSKHNIDKLYHSTFLAVNANSETIGYLETEPLKNACIYENNKLSKNMIAVKFGVSKLWVNVKYRNNGVATQLLKQFCKEENLKINDIAFAYPGRYGISFIKKYFQNNSVLIY